MAMVILKPTQPIRPIGNINSQSTLHEDKATITKTLQDITATPAQDPSSTFTFGVSYDWQVELLRMLVYPFVRPLFTPKVIFLLMLNKKIMGSLKILIQAHSLKIYLTVCNYSGYCYQIKKI